MTRYILILLFVLFLNCNKKDDCVKIEEKKEINGEYYFYFKANMSGTSYTDNQGNTYSGSSEDRWGSGKVSKEVYDSHNVGDEYCY